MRAALVLALAAALVSCRKDPAIEAALDSLQASYLDGCIARGVTLNVEVQKSCDHALGILQRYGRKP